MTTTPRFSGKQIVALVAIVASALVLTPVAVGAATGSFVNITDPVNSASKARVNSAGGLWTTLVDPSTKQQARVSAGKLVVGDTSGPLTVDGTVDAVPGAPRQPYVMSLGSEIIGGDNIYEIQNVPAGKTFVIETVSVHIAVPSGQQPEKMLVSCPTGGNTVSHYQQFLFQTAASGYDEFMATNDVHIYCDGGGGVYGGLLRNSTSGPWHMYMTLSGYLA